jgi:hypothetical protein
MSHNLLEEQQEILVLAARKKHNVELQSVEYYGIMRPQTSRSLNTCPYQHGTVPTIMK